MSTALTQYAGAGGELTQWRQPEEVMAEAQRAAASLVKVVEMKKNKVVFNNETYLEFEDWQTVAKFYGCTVKVVSTKYVEFGEANGFEAEAVVLDRNQSEIGRAESMCLNDEENWGMVPKYEWKDVLDAQGKKIWDQKLRNGKGGYKATKEQVGATAKPLFQLRSMAQTRASAKALRSIFAWVVVLAGYRPTPAEEMTGHEFEGEPERDQKPQVQMPRSTDDKKPPVQQGRAETVKQEPQKQQGAPQGQQEASQGAETLSGEIAKVTPGKNGVIVLAVNGQVVVVPAKHASDDFVVGAKLLCSVVKVTIKGQHCLEVRGVEMLVHPVQEGEIVDAEFADVEPKGEDPVLQEARDNGLSGLFEEKAPEQKPQTTMEAPARDTGEATKPGTIGVKRAKRLYAIIGQNRKNTGFGETEMKHILAALPTPLEHLRDLEIGLYEEFEKMATGESDWKQFLDD